MGNIEDYIQFCNEQINMPIFLKYWWMDGVAGKNNWNVVLYKEDGKITASFVYFIKKKYFFNIITKPKHTQISGLWINYPTNISPQKKIDFEKKSIDFIIEKLPKNTSFFITSLHYSFTNWLPFYWKGFKQTSKYTYVIEDIDDIEKVVKNFSKSKSNALKTAEKKLISKSDLDIVLFYNLHKKILNESGREISYSLQHLTSIYEAAQLNNAGKNFYAEDLNGNIHAAIFIIWDNQSAYLLITAIDPKYSSSGASSLLIKNAIIFLRDKTKQFDFEGSMINGVEQSYRGFGGIQRSYSEITKTSSIVLKLLNVFKN